jgi:hypothetical protein
MLAMKGKILFTIKPHSVVDVITNSSTELFVGKNSSKEALEELIKEVYPNYLDEYESLISIDDLTPEMLDTYFDYECSPHCYPSKKSNYPVLPGFTFEELYEEDEIAWNKEMQYKLRNNLVDPDYDWRRRFVTEENFEEMKDKLDPKREMFFLYSIDENPNWDFQELLMNIMTRIHLG